MKKVKIYYLHSGDYIPRYVGSTLQKLQVRKENHSSDFRINSKKVEWIKSLNLNNKTLQIQLIEESDLTDRKERESFWMEYYKDTILNIMFKCSHSDLHKQELSKKLKGRGKLFCHKVKINLAQQQKAKKVIINNIVYNSIHDASRKTGLSVGFICGCCRGYKKSKKYFIEYGS